MRFPPSRGTRFAWSNDSHEISGLASHPLSIVGPCIALTILMSSLILAPAQDSKYRPQDSLIPVPACLNEQDVEANQKLCWISPDRVATNSRPVLLSFENGEKISSIGETKQGFELVIMTRNICGRS